MIADLQVARLTPASPLAAALRRKDAEIETLRERVRQLEVAIRPRIAYPPEWPHLTPGERVTLECLAARDVATHDAIVIALSSVGHGNELSAPLEAMRIRIYMLRKKLGPLGVVISRHEHYGYSLDSRTQQRLRAVGGTP